MTPDPCRTLLPRGQEVNHQKVNIKSTSLLICAGMLANSGLLAKADRFSTASSSGAVATRHLLRFSSEKSASAAWKQEEQR